MLLTNWLPQVLKDAGISFVITSGWENRSHGELADELNVVWHHDASPPGDSPGALGWMISNWDEASAQIWVDRRGVWHLVGVGVAWHAGSTGSGFPTNRNSIGIETDHTTGEDWPDDLLQSLRRGTAAILKARGRTSSALYFHKQIAIPFGRKQDPDGLDINLERAHVAGLIVGPIVPEVPVTPPATVPTAPKPAPDWYKDMTDEKFLAYLKPLVDGLAAVKKDLAALKKDVDSIPDAVWTEPVVGKTGSPRQIVNRIYSATETIKNIAAKVDAKVEPIKRG